MPLEVQTCIDLNPDVPPDPVTHCRFVPSVDRNLPDCPEKLGIIWLELPEILPLILISTTFRVLRAVIEPEEKSNPPSPATSLAPDTLITLMSRTPARLQLLHDL